jgi:hypothetical protein
MDDQNQRPDDRGHQTQGRKEDARPERFPPSSKDDSIERSFEPKEERPAPRKGVDEPDPSVNPGRMGPGGDPAEAKR